MFFNLPELVLWKICMTGGTSVLKVVSDSCAKEHQGIVRNTIQADRNKLRQRLRISIIFTEFRDVLMRQLRDLHSPRRCTDVAEMKKALLNFNNGLNMNAGWKQWYEEYGWTFEQVQVLATLGGNQPFAWEVREEALLCLQD